MGLHRLVVTIYRDLFPLCMLVPRPTYLGAGAIWLNGDVVKNMLLYSNQAPLVNLNLINTTTTPMSTLATSDNRLPQTSKVTAAFPFGIIFYGKDLSKIKCFQHAALLEPTSNPQQSYCRFNKTAVA